MQHSLHYHFFLLWSLGCYLFCFLLVFTSPKFLSFVFKQDHQYNWDDGIHRDHRPEPTPASFDKSSQAQNYKNQGRFATIKSASLVRT